MTQTGSGSASPSSRRRRSPAALAVAMGIFLSRIAGFIRDRVFAHYLGNSDAAGAFRAALRIPNLLQNLFGEGVLSASFIPVYARLLEEGREEEAGRVAGVILSLLIILMALLVGLGVIFSRHLIDILAPGFHGEVRELTIRLVTIMFPGIGLLVISAWCLGILNSHRRFFLSYVAPVLWNAAIISTLIVVGGRFASDAIGQMEIAIWAAWGTVLGAGLQLLVQLPLALRLNRGLHPSVRLRSEPVRRIVANFFPAVMSRGVAQISAYIDQILASYLGPQMVAAMAYAQTIYTLPVSLFGMAISASELTEMARTTGSSEAVMRALVERLVRGLQRLAFYVVPSAVAFCVLGDVIASTLFQTGRFGQTDAQVVWYILAGSAVGLVASTQSRLCVSVFWALGDTRTPLRFSLIRLVLTAVLGFVATFPLREMFAWPVVYSAAALTASAGMAGWIEFYLIRRALQARVGTFHVGGKALFGVWFAALVAAGLAFVIKTWLPPLPPLVAGPLVLGVYGGVYLGLAALLGQPEVRSILRRLR